MKVRKCIALFIALYVTLLCYSQNRVQSRDVNGTNGVTIKNDFEVMEGATLKIATGN